MKSGLICLEKMKIDRKGALIPVSLEKIIKELNSPGEEFTPVPFWFFNDTPDEERIRNQLRDYQEKGVDAFVLHPRIGIPEDLPYLSEAYFDAVKFIVKTADELGMKVVLYDEGMYPSGSAHGMVVKKNPEYASRGITLVKEPGDQKVLARMASGDYLVEDYTKGTIRGIHFGEDDGEAGAPPSADILNPEAVAEFIHLTHDQYYEHLKEYFGNTIIGFFTDEPCALGRNAEQFREWAAGMDREILEAGGKLEDLEGLFTGRKNKTTDLYRKLVKKHLRETFYKPLSKWCVEHGIAFMGHPAESDDVEEELYFQIPGQDLIMRREEPKMGGIAEADSVHAKLSADIARHLGRRRNLNECFGVCSRKNMPWYFTGEDMKWYIDWLAMRGVNLFIPHAFYYSVAGERKGERPPDVGPNNIWWNYYRTFSDYMKRLSYLMTDSVNGAKVAVLCDNNKVPCKEVMPFYENQVEFNYLPVALLPECRIENGKLCIGAYQYETVCDPWNLGNTEQLTGVKVVQAYDDSFEKTILTEQPHKNLRAVHLTKDGQELYLLSNEGDSQIHMNLQKTDIKQVVLYDLWTGTASRAENSSICLNPCETILLIQDPEQKIQAETAKKPEIQDWSDRMELVEKKANQAVYRGFFDNHSPEPDMVVEFHGEEMAECFCNGQFAGVSFWNPHRFQVGPFLKPGENEIQVVFTGNAANLYTDAKIEYGIMK